MAALAGVAVGETHGGGNAGAINPQLYITASAERRNSNMAVYLAETSVTSLSAGLGGVWRRRLAGLARRE